jgi:hypothetical protein
VYYIQLLLVEYYYSTLQKQAMLSCCSSLYTLSFNNNSIKQSSASDNNGDLSAIEAISNHRDHEMFSSRKSSAKFWLSSSKSIEKATLPRKTKKVDLIGMSTRTSRDMPMAWFRLGYLILAEILG